MVLTVELQSDGYFLDNTDCSMDDRDPCTRVERLGGTRGEIISPGVPAKLVTRCKRPQWRAVRPSERSGLSMEDPCYCRSTVDLRQRARLRAAHRPSMQGVLG